MNQRLVIFWLLLRVAVGHRNYLYKDDEEAIPVIDFDGAVSEGVLFASTKPKVVEIYSPFCGHCIAFKPQYVQKARTVTAAHPEIEFHAISCKEYHDICMQFKPRGFPSLYVVPEGARDAISAALPLSRSKLDWEGIQEQLLSAPTNPQTERELDENDNKNEKESAKESSRGLHSDDADEKQEAKSGEEDEESLGVENEQAESGDLPSEDTDNEPPAVENEQAESGDLPSEDTDNEPPAVENQQAESEDLPSEDTDNEPPAVENQQAESGDLASQGNENLESPEELRSNEDDEGEDFQPAPLGKDEGEMPLAPSKEMKDEYSEDSESFDQPGPNLPKAGAELAKRKAHQMDKYNDQMQKEKERIERRNKRLQWVPGKTKQRPSDIPAVDGATKVMRANQANTQEYDEHRKKYIEFMEKMKEKHKNIDASRRPGKMGKVAFEKQVTKTRVVERLPVVRRVVRMTPEEELILDASLAIMHGLNFNVFRSRNPLTATEKLVLAHWLDLLAVGLPAEWSVQSLVQDLKENLDFAARNYENLKQVLERHKIPRKRFSKSCASGIPCGYWKLFHAISVGMAEHRGGLNLIDSGILPTTTRVFSPSEAADVIKDFVQHFFYCSECASSFVTEYGNCDKNRRCDRLSSDTTYAKDNDWKEMALWLWEVHNDLNVKLLNQNADARLKKKQHALLKRAPAGPGIAPAEQAVKVLWPHMGDCVSCHNFDGTWNENAVFGYLEQTYWPGFDFDFEHVDARLVHFIGDNDSGSRVMAILAFALFCMFYYMRKSLNSPNLQRTMLLAKSMGPSLTSGPKKRSA